jgi:hypothetical protein
MGGPGLEACMGDIRNSYKILVGKPEGRDHSGKLVINGKIIQERILGKQDWCVCGMDSYGSRQEPVAGSCEHNNEPLGSIKGRKFLD